MKCVSLYGKNTKDSWKQNSEENILIKDRLNNKGLGKITS
jgi:hypothetical protein